jgi:DNA-directed RNA polymerase specialized sigma24 family protein
MNESSSKPGRDWTPTPEAFKQVLDKLDADQEQASKKYEELRHKLIRYFEFHGGSPPDVLADKTIDIVAGKVIDGAVIQNIGAFAMGVARRIAQEYWRSKETKTISIEGLEQDWPLDIPDPEEKMLRAETERREKIRLKCMVQCLDELPPDDLSLMLQYQMGEKSERIRNREMLAKKLSISLLALRQRAHKIRAKLRECVERRLKRTATIGKTS